MCCLKCWYSVWIVGMVITMKHVSAVGNLLEQSNRMFIFLFSHGRMSHPVQKQHRSLNSAPAINVKTFNSIIIYSYSPLGHKSHIFTHTAYLVYFHFLSIRKSDSHINSVGEQNLQTNNWCTYVYIFLIFPLNNCQRSLLLLMNLMTLRIQSSL